VRSQLGRVAFTTMLALTALVGAILAAEAGLLSSLSRVMIYVIVNFVLLFDMIDLLARMWLIRIHGAVECGPSIDLGLAEISAAERSVTMESYAIIVSVHNASNDIDRFLKNMRPFQDVIWLIDDASNDTTLLRLRRAGWTCLAGGVNRKKPGALLSLLKSMPADIQTIVVIDPDIRWCVANPRILVERVVSDLQRSGAAALTPRVRARRKGWLSACQAFEYELSCGLGRKALGDIACNSGASIYRRAALEDALGRHSLSVYAEDLENSLLLLAAGKRIYYDDRLVIETDAKQGWRGLFSQRVGWAFGGAKLYLERLPLFLQIGRRSPLAAYQYIIYLGINGIVLFPFKIASLLILAMSFLKALDDLFLIGIVPLYTANDPALFALWYIKSTIVLTVACLIVAPRRERWPHLVLIPLYPFYALTQYLPVAVGYLNVLALKLLGRRLYNDHYDATPVIASPLPAQLIPEAGS
jgi:cellulose synthase/poly-beta-1,6-N-acetylglucosamine synthase-like glycosyltransferase